MTKFESLKACLESKELDQWTCVVGLRVVSVPAAKSPKLFCTNVYIPENDV